MKLLKENFGPGDKLVNTSFNANGNGEPSNVSSQGIITKSGRKVLLINKLNKDASIQLSADSKGASATSVDVSTGENPPSQMPLSGNTVVLKPFSVTVIALQ